MKIKTRVTITLNAKESRLNHEMMHKLLDAAEPGALKPEITKEEAELIKEYDQRLSLVDHAMAVLDGEATAVYGNNHRS